MEKLNTEIWIEKAKLIHKDNYDYKLVNYINSKSKIKIICKKSNHIFEQRPNDHLQGKGCGLCNKLTTQIFINKSNEVHNFKFSYPNAHYINNRTKIKIECVVHGEFEQIPVSHMAGAGCHACLGTKKVSTEDYINRVKNIHIDDKGYPLYIYDNTIYINTNTMISIDCPKHGKFLLRPTTHLNGTGCPTCNSNTLITKEEFIKKAQLIHNNKFDYSLVKIENIYQKVIIICEHGRFEQLAYSHLRGHSCIKCRNGMTTEEFIKKSLLKHGKKYDYSLVNYVTANDKVKIKCKKHGIFLQTAYSHLEGWGCAKCSGKNKTIEERIEGWNVIHSFKYNYSKVIYVNNKINMIIVCPTHGDFSQQPSGHQLGAGCPLCNVAGTLSEFKLFKKIKETFNKNEIIRQGKPDWIKINKKVHTNR